MTEIKRISNPLKFGTLSPAVRREVVESFRSGKNKYLYHGYVYPDLVRRLKEGFPVADCDVDFSLCLGTMDETVDRYALDGTPNYRIEKMVVSAHTPDSVWDLLKELGLDVVYDYLNVTSIVGVVGQDYNREMVAVVALGDDEIDVGRIETDILVELQKYVRSENLALSEMIDEYYTDGAIMSWIEDGLGYLFDADGSLVYDLPARNW